MYVISTDCESRRKAHRKRYGGRNIISSFFLLTYHIPSEASFVSTLQTFFYDLNKDCRKMDIFFK